MLPLAYSILCSSFLPLESGTYTYSMSFYVQPYVAKNKVESTILNTCHYTTERVVLIIIAPVSSQKGHVPRLDFLPTATS